MFTGLVERLGEVKNNIVSNGILTLTLDIRNISGIVPGDSIACNGVCLTVVEIKDGYFVFELMSETQNRTLIPLYRKGRIVNTERALAADGRFDGHIVQGHVDAVGVVTRIFEKNGERIILFRHPGRNDEFIVNKGSIAVDGISLTVTESFNEGFGIGVIPHTLAHTTLGKLLKGDKVHLEYDIIGKYVSKFMHRHRNDDGIDLEEVLKKW